LSITQTSNLTRKRKGAADALKDMLSKHEEVEREEEKNSQVTKTFLNIEAFNGDIK
jgi:hypothetical protein